MLVALLTHAHAAALLGAAFVPVGVGALAWDDANGFSGSLVGELDGYLRPPLTAHGGWVGKTDAVLANAAVARFATSRWGEGHALDAVSAVRLGLDYRRWLWAREAGRVGMYGTLGGYGILPSAVDTDSNWTEDEQADADEGAAETEGRIGGVGGQLGIGADYIFGDAAGRPAVSLGLRTVVRMHRGQIVDDTATTVSTALLTETALVLEFCR
ncbi:MAG: hypothetical protein ACOZNI_15940 [Myxococcota bacterium]